MQGDLTMSDELKAIEHLINKYIETHGCNMDCVMCELSKSNSNLEYLLCDALELIDRR